MEDFFSKYRNKLLNHEQPAFEENDWKKLELPLDQQKNSKKRFGFIWLPFFIAFPILVGWSFLNWKNGSDIKFKNNSTILTETISIHDTVYIREYVDKPRIVYIKEYATNSSFNPKPTALKDQSLRYYFETDSLHKPIAAQLSLSHQSIEKLKSPIPKEEISKEQFKENLVGLNSFPADSIVELPKVDPDVLLAVLSEKNSIYKKIKRAMVPCQMFAGVHIAYPMVVESYAVNKLGYVFGIDAAVLFHSRFKLSIASQFENLFYGSESLEEGSDIPVVDPPSPEFVFNKVEISKSSYNIASILSYRFLGIHQFKPVIGLGLNFKHAIPFQVVYEFEQPQLQIDWLYETKFNPKYINSIYWSLVAGIDYEASSRWHYNLQTSWLNCFNNNKHHQPDIFNIQLGLQYKFILK